MKLHHAASHQNCVESPSDAIPGNFCLVHVQSSRGVQFHECELKVILSPIE
jgi:hypothetical protein